MTSVGKWVAGARPRTLVAAIAPVMVATAFAGSQWSPWRALLALIVSLALQIGVNYANDYSDGIRGTDDSRIGPMRLTASGLAKPGAVKAAAAISFLVAALAGLALASLTTWWLVLVGALAINAAWGYTGGKKPYGYAGFGEVVAFLFFGPVAVFGTTYVQIAAVFDDALTILVTGGAGYIGSVVAEQLLVAGDEVVVYDALRTGHGAAVPVIEAHASRRQPLPSTGRVGTLRQRPHRSLRLTQKSCAPWSA